MMELFIFRFAHQDMGNKTQMIIHSTPSSLSAGYSTRCARSVQALPTLLRINSTNDFASKSKSYWFKMNITEMRFPTETKIS